jgi:hypothetical protein
MTNRSGIYFGKPGSLVALYDPRGGIRGTRARPTGRFQPGDGGASSERRLNGARQYTLGYESLSRADFHTLLQYDQGHMGTGPWVLIDPGQRNMLMVNQSSTTSLANEALNFSIAGSGWSLASEATTVRRGPRSLRMLSTYAGVNGTVTLDSPYRGWPGIPVVDRAHVFSMYIRSALDNAVTVTATVTWLDANGADLGGAASNAGVAASGAWTALSATADPPATVAFARLSVTVTGSTMNAGASVYLDEMQFEEGSTAGAWSPGTGVFPVVIQELDDNWPWLWPDYRGRPAFVLTEDTS